MSIEAIRAALEAGPTEGPWHTVQVGDRPTKFAVANDEGISLLTLVDEEGHDFAAVYEDADASFIAACNPSAIRELLDRLEAAEKAVRWQPIETAPKDGRKLLLTYKNSAGLPRIVVGGWVTDEEAAETDEDGVGLEAGWYERIDNWGDYYQVSINEGEPTHWMPLPAAPAAMEGE